MDALTQNTNQKIKIPCAECSRNICNLKECRDFALYEKFCLEKEKQSLRKKHFTLRLTAIFSLITLYCLYS